jgi:hypothetical protein
LDEGGGGELNGAAGSSGERDEIRRYWVWRPCDTLKLGANFLAQTSPTATPTMHCCRFSDAQVAYIHERFVWNEVAFNTSRSFDQGK